MCERLTPAEIALAADREYQGTLLCYAASLLLDDLAAHGYRIVHPDDVVTREMHSFVRLDDPSFDTGWNACRASIFRADDE